MTSSFLSRSSAYFLVSLCAFLFVEDVSAQTQTNIERNTKTWSEVFTQWQIHNPTVIEEKLRLERDQAEISQSLVPKNPDLRIGSFDSSQLFGYPAVNKRPALGGLDVGLRFSVPKLSALFLQNSVVQQQNQALQYGYDEILLQSAHDFALVYESVYRTQRRWERSSRQYEQAKAMFDLRQRQEKAALIQKRDVLKAKINLSVSKQNQQSQQQAHIEAVQRLSEQIAAPNSASNPAPAPSSGFTFFQSIPNNCQEWRRLDETQVSVLLQKHPAVLAKQEEVAAAQTQEQAALLDRIPWISFVQPSYQLGDDNDPDAFQLSFGITLPIFDDNKNSHTFLAAETRLRSVQKQNATLGIQEKLTRLEDAVTAACTPLLQAQSNVNEAKEMIEAFTKQADALEIVQEDVLQMQELLFAAEENLDDAEESFAAAWIGWRFYVVPVLGWPE